MTYGISSTTPRFDHFEFHVVGGDDLEFSVSDRDGLDVREAVGSR